MSTESFDITNLLSGLSLDSLIPRGKERQEALKKLTPVLFTQGGDPAYEAIVQGFKNRNPDHGPFIVLADHDSFHETTALLSRLSGRKPDSHANSSGISKVPDLYTVIQGGPKCFDGGQGQETKDWETSEAATRILKELSNEGKRYHLIGHTTAPALLSILASEEMANIAAVTLRGAVRTLPWETTLNLGLDANQKSELLSRLLESVQKRQIPLYAPSLSLMGIRVDRSDQLPGRGSLASIRMHPDDATRIREQFGSMAHALHLAARAEAFLTTAKGAEDQMHTRLKAAFGDRNPEKVRSKHPWTEGIPVPDLYEAWGEDPKFSRSFSLVDPITRFPGFTRTTEWIADRAMMACPEVAFVPVTMTLKGPGTQVSVVVSSDQDCNCFLPVAVRGPAVEKAFMDSLTPLSKVLEDSAGPSNKTVSVVDLPTAQTWHAFSQVMSSTLRAVQEGLHKKAVDQEWTAERKSAATKVCETALRNLANGSTTEAAKKQYSEEGLDWTVPPPASSQGSG